MINPALYNLARDIGYGDDTIEYAKKLTYNASEKHPMANIKMLFVAALLVSSRLKKDNVLSSERLIKCFEVSYERVCRHRVMILKANNISYVGSEYIKNRKNQQNRRF